MKSYKEINDELTYSPELEEDLLQAMEQARNSKRIPRLRYAMVSSLVIVCGGILWYAQQPPYIKDDLKTASAQVSQSFELENYLMDDTELVNSAKTIGVLDIVGDFQEMSPQLREDIAFAPKEEDLILPKGYQTNVSFQQYTYESNGPYALIQYHSEKGDEFQFDFSISDEHIPKCTPFDFETDTSLKQYREYHLGILNHIDDQGAMWYSVYGYRDGYYIEGSARVEKEEDFINFLNSFLR